VPGKIKNVFTKRDLILLIYTATERDYAIGRNPVFVSRDCRNPAYDEGGEPMVSDTPSFWLKNFDLQSLGHDSVMGVGHTDYRSNLLQILEFI
jgi:hypothetical protein